MGRVVGKMALVVGAAGGVGGAGAEALAREGAAVFCTDRESRDSPRASVLQAGRPLSDTFIPPSRGA